MTHVDGGGVLPGTQLNGIYEINKRVAIGGMGEVYIGHVIQTGDLVAIKMILPEHANNTVIVDLFRREASTLHNLYHEAIVRYYVFSVDPVLNRPYLAMEYAEGPSLGERLRDGPLDEEALTVLRRRVAGGLHAAHRLGIIHRDMSPDNIILLDGEVGRAKIIDFGIAKSTTHEGTLIGSGFAGKLNYVSPEQLGLFGGEITAKSDIYSLGLVFAQAAIGRPLPMAGSQVEVVEKRRVLPDLSEIPPFIRPLIEAMVQPDPADRPASMQEVADWLPHDRRAAATAGIPDRPVHPRERRRGTPPAEPRKRGPWIWLGLGGAAVAATVAAVLLVGGDGSAPPIPGREDDPGLVASPTIEPPAAIAGEAYEWTMPPFDLEGSLAGLGLKVDGELPPGITVELGDQGRARLAGTPGGEGVYAFDVLASTPDGKSAWHEVRLTVRKSQRIALNQPSAGGTKPVEQDRVDPEPGQGAKNGVPGGDAVLSGGSSASVSGTDAAPTLAIVDPGNLAPPSAETEGGVGSGVSNSAPSAVRPVPSALSKQKGAGGLPVIPLPDPDPTQGSVEPKVFSVVPENPGALESPADASGVTAAPAGDAAPIPNTGQPQRPTVAASASDPAIAAIPAPENEPPTLSDALAGPLAAKQGQEINLRIGAFDDEEGAGGLRIDVQGTLPKGVSVRLAEGGVAQLHGAPGESGEFDFLVAAVDPQGLTSRPVAVRLSVGPPDETRSVRDYILGYDGGDCFLSRPIELGPRLARIEVFAAESRVQPVLDFDAAFKREMGFEATIGMRPITDDQCGLIHALDQLGPQALDNSLAIALERDELASGNHLSGTIRGGEDAKLYLFDNAGGVTNLSNYLANRNGEVGFSVPISGAGPQILIAAEAQDDNELPATVSFEELLAAARRGDVALALGFFIMKG
jgi:serine/threonine-protein kinase